MEGRLWHLLNIYSHFETRGVDPLFAVIIAQFSGKASHLMMERE